MSQLKKHKYLNILGLGMSLLLMAGLDSSLYGQETVEETKEEIKPEKSLYENNKDWLNGRFGKYIRAWEPNYFLFGFNKETYTKLQISIAYQLFDFGNRYSDAFFFSYTMKAFWNLYGDPPPFHKAPVFKEYNHKPELLYKPSFDIPILKEVGIGLGHESAGVGTRVEDYPVNWISADITLDLFYVLIRPRVYFYFIIPHYDYNHKHGKGPFRLDINIPFQLSTLDFNIGTTLRINTGSYLANGGNITSSISIKIKKFFGFGIMFQHFYGFAESRMSSNEKREHIVRLGVVM